MAGFVNLILLLACQIFVTEGKVIVVSIDGLRPDAITAHGPEKLPNFYRLRAEGAFTDNARTDFDYSETLPNHASMITGRPVLGGCGHGLNVNFGGANTKLHGKGYIASMFDVAHDNGLSTSLYATKGKFSAFSANYDAGQGAPDLTGLDHGRDKLDFYYNGASDVIMIPIIEEDFPRHRWDFSMIHLRTLDSVGHTRDWDLDLESDYMNAVVTIDGYLGKIFDLIELSPDFAGETNLIVTTDHGGTKGTYTHTVPEIPTNYTIPFYVWGPGVKAGADLYELNPDFKDPGTSRPLHDALNQPIRNGMVGNLALDLLRLPAIPGSCLNAAQGLRVSDSPVFDDLHPGLDPTGDANGNGYSNFFDYALGANPEAPHDFKLMPQMTRGRIKIFRRLNAPDVGMGLEMSLNGKSPWYPLIEGFTYRITALEETTLGRQLDVKILFVSEKAFIRQTFIKKEAL